jgi:hypothetical protein
VVLQLGEEADFKEQNCLSAREPNKNFAVICWHFYHHSKQK